LLPDSREDPIQSEATSHLVREAHAAASVLEIIAKAGVMNPLVEGGAGAVGGAL
jgi:hypothetical protein